jgi:hypothetical protein
MREVCRGGGNVRRLALVTVLLLMATACDGSDGDAEAVIDPGDGGDYSVTPDPADFVAIIDNPLLPLIPGSRWVYEAQADDEIERIEVVVTDQTREIMGINTTVVRDTVSVGGELIEDTYDWYAQDSEGNVWYMGEDSTEFEDGEPVSTGGSWEAGVDGALPGIIMYADPQIGDAYRQEFYAGEAEDLAEVVRTGESATVPFGAFDDLIVMREWTPLEPDVVEEKYYSPGIGVILEVQVEGGEERAELISFEPGG